MIISNFTKPEIDYLLKNCNFTQQEESLFKLRASGISLDLIADDMNISRDWAGKLSQKVNRKILKVI